MMIICSWFMLRELEISFARDTHLTLHGEEVQLLVPVHKTNTMGSLTVRSLQCACGVQDHPLCPWHAAERHLIRLSSHPQRRPDGYLPLFPQSDGNTATKYMLVKNIRQTLEAGGLETTLTDDGGKLVEKYSGHCLRVSGAQFLAAAGVQVALIQLLGRWSSSAVERYIQQAPLSMVPQIPTEVLGHSGSQRANVRGDVGTAVGPSPITPAPLTSRNEGVSVTPYPLQGQLISDPEEGQNHRAQLAAQKRLLRSLQGDVASLQRAIKPPREVLIVRPRSSVVHRSTIDESQNQPSIWRSVCGWKYGCTRFFRVGVVSDTQRFCKKCFEQSERQDSDGAEDSKEDSDSSSSGSSSSDPSS